jgi:hypothetical protein
VPRAAAADRDEAAEGLGVSRNGLSTLVDYDLQHAQQGHQGAQV